MEETARKLCATIVLVALTALPLGGCTKASAPVPTAESAPTATLLFCAYGGVGTVPDPLPPGYETEFASIVVELDNPGSAIDGVTVLGASLLECVTERDLFKIPDPLQRRLFRHDLSFDLRTRHGQFPLPRPILHLCRSRARFSYSL